ncbi:uncharacterized protein MICPUCDRAFT_50302 [Micromonas pusilla CCMP1545]|jgi:hypothetical protein|uniref:Predicted protein n=1 Tax=Micromonas pusilla (strain CCMP1545) TaxID=564608 RepID=C1MHS2_MICPC|nr:uncharacterized protein MICPUCDRAFT_50302 [Micromonas pusilla CCMP1545]EEH60255.1 predicted protein [Micromonas pusilla CCMP1545]|eukprot:XP_003055003.1 predicted protein [Micromonas pusilla CCMP1545]
MAAAAPTARFAAPLPPRASAPAPARRARAHARASSSSASASADVAALKKDLLAAVAASRKPGADPSATKRAILDATDALESIADDVPFLDVSGRWSLVYSTSDASSALGPLQAVLDDDAFQKLVDTLYKTFFTFLPSLAGSAETGARGVANQQMVDIENGRVVNVVDVELAFGGAVRVGVMGTIEAKDPDAREVVVTFTDWEIGPAPGLSDGGAGEQPRVRLPLPRPKGALKNTFCDETLRISRGGRGGVFITSRVD